MQCRILSTLKQSYPAMLALQLTTKPHTILSAAVMNGIVSGILLTHPEQLLLPRQGSVWRPACCALESLQGSLQVRQACLSNTLAPHTALPMVTTPEALRR